MRSRSGTILIIVASISALLASLAVTFLIRQQASQQETMLFEQDIQARLMLVAGCSYICETARIGYDHTTAGNEHTEAFGWIDVRDGSVGPNTRGVHASDVVALFDDARMVERWGRSRNDRPAWPAQKSVARCPMQVLSRPPYAIQPDATPNAIIADESHPDFGRPYLRRRDPMPVTDDRAKFMKGDWNVRVDSANRSWFRVYREGPATFIVTCGAGGTQGFRDWDEVAGAGEEALFGDQTLFLSLANQEYRLWYRVEWSPMIATPEVHNIKNAWNEGAEDHYVSYGMNTSNSSINPRSQAQCRNLGGTFRYVQRLRQAPTWW